MSPDSMTSGWYYARAGSSAGQEVGPLSWEELYILARSGTIAPTDIVWNPRLPRGVTAALIPGLFPAPAPTAPAPQTAAPAMPVPQPLPVVQQPVQPPLPEPIDPVWDVIPAAVQTPTTLISAEPKADQQAKDLFVEELVETPDRVTTAQETPPEEPRPPRAKKQNGNLPWLIVLLILAIAVAGVAAYFLYFRSADDKPSAGQTTTVSGFTTTTKPGGSAPAIWTKLVTSGDAPAARSYHAMAYDPTSKRTILFGGSDRSGKLDDTWALDLGSKTWTRLATATGPSARDYAQMVYDVEGGGMILFGGSDDSEDRNDLWALDTATSTWTELKPAGVLPQAREGHGMVYDPNTKRVLVFGGLNRDSGELLNDFWAYDLTTNTWTRLEPSGGLPAERELPAMAYSPGSRRVLLFGGLALGESTDADLGDMWAYDPIANTWAQVAPTGTTPSSRQGHAMVGAPALGDLLMFGGLHANTDLDETWLFDSVADAWSRQQPVGGAPGARDGHAMAYDSAAGSVILFGGFDPAAKLELADTWVYGPSLAEDTPVPPQ